VHPICQSVLRQDCKVGKGPIGILVNAGNLNRPDLRFQWHGKVIRVRFPKERSGMKKSRSTDEQIIGVMTHRFLLRSGR
jgi:hypothetical protein